ncbi:M23 family metallopeptidase [Streptomyces pathocidini]|uniref:M23 family metallopeptidase n=1 Tax=Streptomyces pathocidini TaxID=1650571 RepID=A0ABW7UVU9_9ACTN|nr:M23 family metallopeptidase [Streptomyces pathocidini]
MNDRHPSGTSTPTAQAPDASYGQYPTYEQQGAYGGYAGYDGTASHDTWGTATGTFDGYAAPYGDGDPLFGTTPGAYDTGQGTYGTGHYDTTQWDAGVQQPAYDPYATGAFGTSTFDAAGFNAAAYETGAYDTSGMWGAATVPAQGGPAPVEHLDSGVRGGDPGGQWDTTAWATGSYDMSGITQDAGASAYETGGFETSAFEAAPYETGPFETGPFETGQFEAAQFQTGQFETGQAEMGQVAADPYQTGQFDTGQFQTGQFDTGQFQTGQWEAAAHPGGEEVRPDLEHTPEPVAEQTAAFEALSDPSAEDSGEPGGSAKGVAPMGRRGAGSGGGGGRSRRRAPARRSAILTVAVPSVAVMGVAGIAAASVSTGQDKSAQAAPDPSAVKPSAANNKLDSQLAGLTADADDFADRASRTQERLDLKQRQLEEKKRKEEEAARKEALRPKFALPVAQHGLSAYFGQAGINWMSVHSGIDFPVSYGTPVMAATDGAVRTQWNPAYGNMAIVTAADGTETWYCHLSSTKIRSGSVKAGDTIAYSGNSGNSTGPHLHFEVRPGGGSAIDPLAWFQGKGINPN